MDLTVALIALSGGASLTSSNSSGLANKAKKLFNSLLQSNNFPFRTLSSISALGVHSEVLEHSFLFSDSFSFGFVYVYLMRMFVLRCGIACLPQCGTSAFGLWIKFL